MLASRIMHSFGIMCTAFQKISILDGKVYGNETLEESFMSKLEIITIFYVVLVSMDRGVHSLDRFNFE